MKNLAKFSDGISMKGTLTVITRDAQTGKQLRRCEIRNKITFGAADTLVELWAQRTAPIDQPPLQNRIYSMRMGTADTVASRAHTNLGACVIGVELTDVNKVTGIAGELQFIAILGAGDANGYTLQEAGLFTQGDISPPNPIGTSVIVDPVAGVGTPRMISRQVHPAIPKSAAITIEYQWAIAFTA